jgi:glutathione S-transferase
MLTLHEYAPSQNCWKVLLGVPYRSQPVPIFSGESRTAEFLALNPVGSTPALTLDDGRAIAESNAILCYLAEGTRYMPAPDSPDGRFGRAKVMQWLFFEQYYVEPVIGSLRFWTLTGRLESNAGLVPGKRDAAMRALSAGAHVR